MQRNRAFGVIKAAARLKILAAHARARVGAAADEEQSPLTAFEAPLLETADSTEPGSHAVPSSAGDLPLLQSRRSNGAPPALVNGLSGAGASVANPMGTPHGVKPKQWYKSDLTAIKEIFLSSWLNVLLLCAPLGFASEYLHWGAVATFTLNFCALVPLALILGDITEDLAVRFGDVIGGLLNATFGNVVEIILSISALQRGLYTVVATSLLGSILSNLLLVLGCCMIFGGYNFSLQYFNATGNRACSSLLFLAALGIIVPTAADVMWHTEHVGEEWMLAVSRGTAIILLICYACYLVFQLRTHKHMFQGEEEDGAEPMLSVFTALSLLGAITVTVAVSSEFLTGSIEEVSHSTGLGQAFLGMIVLPIAGNACEHITAVVVASKNKMDLALGVAVGSSIQIALFAIPFAVIFAWITGHDFGLSFDPFSALVLALSVIHANFITNDAQSHWLLGVQLVAVYILIALTYLYR